MTPFSENLFKENEKLWIQVEVDFYGNGFEVISPRESLSAVPYAFLSNQAYSADYASKAGLAEKAKTLDGYSLSDILASKEVFDSYWNLLGNAGTTPGTNFLGTTDNQAFEVKVNNTRAMRIEPTTKAPNIIEGYSGNLVTPLAYSSTIGGGGSSGWVNKVTDNYGTVGGGANNLAGDNAGITSDRPYATVGGGYTNTAKGYASTIPGGYWNIASGTYSFAAGRRARASHTGTFVWADSTDADFASTGVNQFLIRAGGGVGIGTASPKAKLDVQGNATISGIIQSGTLTDPVAYNRIGNGTASQFNIDSKDDLFINGNLEVKGSVYWGSKTSSYSILPLDCNPQSSGYEYFCFNTVLYKKPGYTGSQIWSAPVHLPNSAVVTSLTVWYIDNSASDITFYLDRFAYGYGSNQNMASVTTSGTSGDTYITDSTINYTNINNNNYAYFLSFVLPSGNIGSTLCFRNARISFTTITP